MASMTIRYEVDPQTGERRIIVSYQSDADALPMEHEEDHRELVEKLIEGGLINASEAGQITIEREAAPPATATKEPSAEEQTEGKALKQGE